MTWHGKISNFNFDSLFVQLWNLSYIVKFFCRSKLWNFWFQKSCVFFLWRLFSLTRKRLKRERGSIESEESYFFVTGWCRKMCRWHCAHGKMCKWHKYKATKSRHCRIATWNSLKTFSDWFDVRWESTNKIHMQIHFQQKSLQ